MTQPPAPESYLRRLVPILCWCVFCSVLNGTMFNIAVPDIARDFNLNAAAVSWIITGYIVIFALGAISYGKLADSYPVRNLLTVGLLLFSTGALISLIAENYPLLVTGRMIQASGGASIPALVMIIATRFSPPEIRGRVLGAVAGTVALGMGLGPLVGGLLAGSIHWRWLFTLSFFTLPAIPLLARFLPREETRPLNFDLLGAAWLALLIILLLIGITLGQPGALAASLPVLLILNRHLKTTPVPFIPRTLLQNRRYRNGLLVTFLAIGPIFGMLFAIPLLLRQVHGAETLIIGLAIFPGAFCASLAGLFGGRLADRLGTRPVSLYGLGLLILGYLLLATLAQLSPLAVILILVLCYTGFALLQPALGKTISLLLPVDQSGIGMGFYNLVYFLSGAFGTALIGSLLEFDLPSASWLGAQPMAGYRLTLSILALATGLAALIFWSSLRSVETDSSSRRM
jgi:DHA2 family metal-tetracycline-proton antiporter-like MFS transporter